MRVVVCIAHAGVSGLICALVFLGWALALLPNRAAVAFVPLQKFLANRLGAR
jgi:uncharacterized membrane protein YagU involved in acid resistance